MSQEYKYNTAQLIFLSICTCILGSIPGYLVGSRQNNQPQSVVEKRTEAKATAPISISDQFCFRDFGEYNLRSNNLTGIVSEDFDFDGRPDIAVLSNDANKPKVIIYKNRIPSVSTPPWQMRPTK